MHSYEVKAKYVCAVNALKIGVVMQSSVLTTR